MGEWVAWAEGLRGLGARAATEKSNAEAPGALRFAEKTLLPSSRAKVVAAVPGPLRMYPLVPTFASFG